MESKIEEVNIERAFPGEDIVVAEKAGIDLSWILEEIKKDFRLIKIFSGLFS